jgi:hypothetical protein
MHLTQPFYLTHTRSGSSKQISLTGNVETHYSAPRVVSIDGRISVIIGNIGEKSYWKHRATLPL